MRSFISRTIAALIALALCAGAVGAQGKKKKKRAAAKTTAAKSSKSEPSSQSSLKTPTETYTGDPVPPTQAPEPGDGVRRITPAEARAALQNGTAVIIDVRGEQSYMAGHIAGATLIPFNNIASRINELPRNKLIITYCS